MFEAHLSNPSARTPYNWMARRCCCLEVSIYTLDICSALARMNRIADRQSLSNMIVTEVEHTRLTCLAFISLQHRNASVSGAGFTQCDLDGIRVVYFSTSHRRCVRVISRHLNTEQRLKAHFLGLSKCRTNHTRQFRARHATFCRGKMWT